MPGHLSSPAAGRRIDRQNQLKAAPTYVGHRAGVADRKKRAEQDRRTPKAYRSFGCGERLQPPLISRNAYLGRIVLKELARWRSGGEAETAHRDFDLKRKASQADRASEIRAIARTRHESAENPAPYCGASPIWGVVLRMWRVIRVEIQEAKRRVPDSDQQVVDPSRCSYAEGDQADVPLLQVGQPRASARRYPDLVPGPVELRRARGTAVCDAAWNFVRRSASRVAIEAVPDLSRPSMRLELKDHVIVVPGRDRREKIRHGAVSTAYARIAPRHARGDERSRSISRPPRAGATVRVMWRYKTAPLSRCRRPRDCRCHAA